MGFFHQSNGSIMGSTNVLYREQTRLNRSISSPGEHRTPFLPVPLLRSLDDIVGTPSSGQRRLPALPGARVQGPSIVERAHAVAEKRSKKGGDPLGGSAQASRWEEQLHIIGLYARTIAYYARPVVHYWSTRKNRCILLVYTHYPLRLLLLL